MLKLKYRDSNDPSKGRYWLGDDVITDAQASEAFHLYGVDTRVFYLQNHDSANYAANYMYRDRINGDSRDNTIWSFRGDDVLVGNGGNDKLYAGMGNDVLNGGDGDDSLHGQWGNDTYYAGNGDDNIVDDGGGDDVLFLDGGNDRAWAGDGDDQIYGGKGRDYIEGGAGNDLMNGNSGADWLIGNDGDDVIHGGNFDPSNDVGNGMPPDDSLLEDPDADWDFLSLYYNVLDGGGGNDTLVGSDSDGDLFRYSFGESYGEDTVKMFTVQQDFLVIEGAAKQDIVIDSKNNVIEITPIVSPEPESLTIDLSHFQGTAVIDTYNYITIGGHQALAISFADVVA